MLRTVLDSGCKGMKELEGEGIKKGSDKKKKKTRYLHIPNLTTSPGQTYFVPEKSL